MILLKLEGFDLIREIWQYFYIKDIVSLLRTNSNVRDMSLRINKLVSQVLDIHLPESPEDEREMMLNNILQLFPNIEMLKVRTAYSFLGSGLGSSLSVLYDYRSPWRKSLKVFNVLISCDKGLSGDYYYKCNIVNINYIIIIIVLRNFSFKKYYFT